MYPSVAAYVSQTAWETFLFRPRRTLRKPLLQMEDAGMSASAAARKGGSMMASFGELLDLWWEHKHDIIIVDGLA